MAALYFIIFFLFCFLSLPSDTEPAYVIMTAVWYQDAVEVPEAYRTIELKVILFYFILFGISYRININTIYFTFGINRINSNSISVFKNFGVIRLMNSLKNSLLICNITLVDSAHITKFSFIAGVLLLILIGIYVVFCCTFVWIFCCLIYHTSKLVCLWSESWIIFSSDLLWILSLNCFLLINLFLLVAQTSKKWKATVIWA